MRKPHKWPRRNHAIEPLRVKFDISCSAASLRRLNIISKEISELGKVVAARVTEQARQQMAASLSSLNALGLPYHHDEMRDTWTNQNGEAVSAEAVHRTLRDDLPWARRLDPVIGNEPPTSRSLREYLDSQMPEMMISPEDAEGLGDLPMGVIVSDQIPPGQAFIVNPGRIPLWSDPSHDVMADLLAAAGVAAGRSAIDRATNHVHVEIGDQQHPDASRQRFDLEPTESCWKDHDEPVDPDPHSPSGLCTEHMNELRSRWNG